MNKYFVHMLPYLLLAPYLCSQNHLGWSEMENKALMLTVALAAIIGPVAGKVYTQCQLATILQNQGFTKSLIPDCKWSAPCRFSLRKDLHNYLMRM
jgi:hypothetical protein